MPKCRYCGRYFKTQGGFKSHIAMVILGNLCPYCRSEQGLITPVDDRDIRKITVEEIIDGIN